jgi:hypothetical protein
VVVKEESQVQNVGAVVACTIVSFASITARINYAQEKGLIAKKEAIQKNHPKLFK